MSFPGGSVCLCLSRELFCAAWLVSASLRQLDCLRVTLSSLYYYILLSRESPTVSGQFQGVPGAILKCFLPVLKILQYGWNILLTSRISCYFASLCIFYVLRSFSSKCKVFILGEIATQQSFPTHICAQQTTSTYSTRT